MRPVLAFVILAACGGRVAPDEEGSAVALPSAVEPGCIAREVQRPGSVDKFYGCHEFEVIVAAQPPSTHPTPCGTCPSGAICAVTLATPTVPSPYGAATGTCR